LEYNEQLMEFPENSGKLGRTLLLPDLSFSYFRGLNRGMNDNLSGYQVGIKIPLLFSGNAARIRAADLEQEIASKEAQALETQLMVNFNKLTSQPRNHEQALNYYEEEGLFLAEEIIKTSNLSFQNGEIN